MLRSEPGDLTRTGTVLGSAAADARDASLRLRDAGAWARLGMPASPFTEALELLTTAFGAQLQSIAAASDQLGEVAAGQGRQLSVVNGLVLGD